METDDFKKTLLQLENIARKDRIAYMCSEAVWWRCHRSLVSDYLKVKGWTVIHIMDIGKGEEHLYTSPARIVEIRSTIIMTNFAVKLDCNPPKK